MTTNKEMNVYIQPDCKVFQVQPQQFIAVSDPVTSSSNEAYLSKDTTNWF